ncbi:hypothetical protein BKA70DRAFT_1225379 [Coprinopsis sp. MPI-PUGE-AT-0042]|nr:hypothetical protein BKA70DRAFT_1225379 [Coprinopsis sp. MPI-PUGE-AT-0042]
MIIPSDGIIMIPDTIHAHCGLKVVHWFCGVEHTVDSMQMSEVYMSSANLQRAIYNYPRYSSTSPTHPTDWIYDAPFGYPFPTEGPGSGTFPAPPLVERCQMRLLVGCAAQPLTCLNTTTSPGTVSEQDPALVLPLTCSTGTTSPGTVSGLWASLNIQPYPASASNQAKRTLNRIDTKRKGLIKIVEDLIENETPSKEGVRKLITAIASFTPDVRAFPSVDNEILLATANMALLEIMHAIGIVEEDEIAGMIEESNTSVKVKQYKASAAPRVKKAAFEALAAQEDVEDLRSLFQTVTGPAGAMPDIDIVQDNDSTEEVGDDRGDLGVAFEATKNYSELALAMGLTRFGLLAMFNKVRHKHGLTAWTKAGKPIFDEYEQGGQEGEFESIKFHWHQLAGMHATLRTIFTKEASLHPSGVLIADEVGLGKTFLAIAVAVFVIQLGMQTSMPPIIRTFPYLGESRSIPDLATLILLPGTVVSQWLGEIYRLLRLHHVDIFIYPTNKAARKTYWDRDGIFAKSKHSPRHRIVVGSQSTLLQDFNSLWNTKKASRTRPWDHPEKLEDFEDNVGATLYGQQWLSIIFDEAQGSRNYGAKHSAALLILEPRRTTRNKRLYLSDCRRARLDRGGGADGEECPLMEVLVAETLRLREKFENRVIHRTKDSLDDMDRPLLHLPPIDIILFVIPLKSWELEHVDASVGDDILESITQATSAGLSTENFFLKERMGVVFPREKDSPLPVYKTRREWEADPPSKLNAVVLLIRHLLRSDDAPMPFTKDFEMVFPNIPDDKPAKQTRKILVFNEFPSFAPLIIQILKLYGINASAINGGLTYQQRAKVVDKFKTQPGLRILILSKVGTVGLNLTEADVLIFLDQQWSEAENEQAIGRLYRQGQTRPVTVYHILASGSIDIFLYALAKSKGMMSEAFLSSAIASVVSEKQKRLVEVIAGYQHLPDEDEEEEEEDPKPTPKRKVKPKPTDRGLADDEEKGAKSIVKKVKRKKPPRKSTFVVDRDSGSDKSMPGPEGTSGSEPGTSTPPNSSEGEENLLQEPKRTISAPRARNSFLTLPIKQKASRGNEKLREYTTPLPLRPTSIHPLPVKAQKAASNPSSTLPLSAARRVHQTKPSSPLLHHDATSPFEQEREATASPIDAFLTPSPHQNASPSRPDDDYPMEEEDFIDRRTPMEEEDFIDRRTPVDEEDFIDRRTPMDEEDDDEDDSMQGIVATPYPVPHPPTHARPAEPDNRTQKRETCTQQPAAPVPSLFYDPILRQPIERSPTPPRRSAAHRRLPSDEERSKPDFVGDSDMEEAVLGPSNPQRRAAHSVPPRRLPEPRRPNASFNPSSSHSSTSGRPHPSNHIASQLAPASSSSRPLLAAQIRPSLPKPAQPISSKADVNRALMGRRLHEEMNRGGAPPALSTPLSGASSTPSVQPSVLERFNRSKGGSWGTSVGSGSLQPSPKYPNPFAKHSKPSQQGHVHKK